MPNLNEKSKENIKKIIADLERQLVEVKAQNRLLEETQKPKIAEIKAKAKVLLSA